jgi:hypothetical protein
MLGNQNLWCFDTPLLGEKNPRGQFGCMLQVVRYGTAATY